MAQSPAGVAVIFISTRTEDHAAEYADMAESMDSLARQQPGFVSVTSVRDPATGQGITISNWADEQAALDFKQVAEHRGAQQAGRDRFYRDYQVIVAQVLRSYAFNT